METIHENNQIVIDELSSFFELLAKFDHEDKRSDANVDIQENKNNVTKTKVNENNKKNSRQKRKKTKL